MYFNHFNFNVCDMERSLEFYRRALGLTPVRRTAAPDGSYRIVFLGDGQSDFQLELTWLAAHPQPYDLGELEYHLALTAPDFTKTHQLHQELGIICYENPQMGIYFIEDPDGYWIEIVPERPDSTK